MREGGNRRGSGIVEHAGATRYAAFDQRGAQLRRDRFKALPRQWVTPEPDLALPERECPVRPRGIVVAVDHRIMRDVWLGAPRLIEQRNQKAEPVRMNGTRRRAQHDPNASLTRGAQCRPRADQIVHDEDRRRDAFYGPSAATPGSVLPSSHSRNAPPAVET